MEQQVKAKKTTRSNYVNIAIGQYNKWKKQKALEEQIAKEVELLSQFDPDKILKDEFESASLHDLQKYLDA